MNTTAANPSTPYQRVERAIHLLVESAPQLPRLEALAQAVNLSPFQFQREFSAWAGLSPLQFSRVLARSQLRERLAGGGALLDVALESGLSSVSRLHDLCVTLDAMTPAECRQEGAGVTIVYGAVDTPLGPALLGSTTRGLCHFQFCSGPSTAAVELLRADWPQATLVENPVASREMAARIFQGGAETPVRVLVRGTNFQVQVWRALLTIPRGQLRSYGHLAAAIGRPQAARAVGTAIGQNPVAVLIPCHRVIQKSGALGGYRWGLSRKAALLAAEAGDAKSA